MGLTVHEQLAVVRCRPCLCRPPCAPTPLYNLPVVRPPAPQALFGTLSLDVMVLTVLYSIAGLGIAIVNDFKSIEGERGLWGLQCRVRGFELGLRRRLVSCSHCTCTPSLLKRMQYACICCCTSCLAAAGAVLMRVAAAARSLSQATARWACSCCPYLLYCLLSLCSHWLRPSPVSLPLRRPRAGPAVAARGLWRGHRKVDLRGQHRRDTAGRGGLPGIRPGRAHLRRGAAGPDPAAGTCAVPVLELLF